MRLAYTTLLFVIISVARADNVTVTPQSYSVDFSDAGLPAGAVVTSLRLEVGKSSDILIRKIPPGWMAGTQSAGPEKMVVYFTRTDWVEGKGRDLPIASLSGLIWIRAKLDDGDRPSPPVVKAIVETPAAGEKYYKQVELSPHAFHLTYVP
jgi:hypothetical protein